MYKSLQNNTVENDFYLLLTIRMWLKRDCINDLREESKLGA